MIDTPLKYCIEAARRAGLENAEQLSEQSVVLRFPSLCAWYREACRERDEMERQRNELLAALESVMDSWQYGETTYEAKTTYDHARSAIEKAKGEKP